MCLLNDLIALDPNPLIQIAEKKRTSIASKLKL
ncbi:hypothetical protein SAMN05216283_102272 [Sunxiuqinia elliptica]|uniref:Uncharacterized protein n=1 Tax=Sunxiuqinia elliptica TaxID=655355 RepID=A0A1I2EX24_9BACT|nr:hypothetical protein SAMN05216283_102272 [Sunxiuqinia elliptica]